MKTKEKIIKRLNKAFGFDFNSEDPCYHHGGRGQWTGTWSWGISSGNLDVGCMEPMNVCLKWDRWVYDPMSNEIYEYRPCNEQMHLKLGDIIEKI